MSALRSEPFLWIHLSGIALFPALLEVVWAGLAIGSPGSFSTLELVLIAIIGILPVLLMQLIRPFEIFSILLFALKPECLSLEQRQILAVFRTTKLKFLSAIAAGIMILLLWLLYSLSPLAIGLASFFPQSHVLGLEIAILAFLGSNLFLQVPISVLAVLLTKKSQLATMEPYPVDKINQDFTVPGIKVNQILWFLDR
jgi:hypothetical protein